MIGLLFCFFEMTCFILKCHTISQENGLFQFQMSLGIHNEDTKV